MSTTRYIRIIWLTESQYMHSVARAASECTMAWHQGRCPRMDWLTFDIFAHLHPPSSLVLLY